MAALARARSVALLRDAVRVASARVHATGFTHAYLQRAAPAAPTALHRALTTSGRAPPSPAAPPAAPAAESAAPSAAPAPEQPGHAGTALTELKGTELVLSPPALVVTREYEWANIIVGFEQANRYTIRAAPGGEVVGYIAEESSMTGVVTRNLLRRRRPFSATVLDRHGDVIFRVRRPLYLVSSSLHVSDADGSPMGDVHMDWHVWRRRYALYADRAQFAAVDSGFLAVDFDMRDVDGRKLAAVNKDFTGIAREIFTDARQYVLRLDPRFGLSADGILVSDASTVAAEAAGENYSDERIDLRQRAVVLATAIAIDFDYFSLHSGGGMSPGLMMMPGGGGGGGGGAGAGAPVAVPPVMPVPPMGGAGGAAGAAVGADVMSDTMGGDGGGDEGAGGEPGADDGFGNESGFDGDAGQADGQSEWATFEEPDHGFNDGFQDDDAWTPDSEDTIGPDFGDMGGDGGGEEAGGLAGGLMDVLRDIFSDN